MPARRTSDEFHARPVETRKHGDHDDHPTDRARAPHERRTPRLPLLERAYPAVASAYRFFSRARAHTRDSDPAGGVPTPSNGSIVALGPWSRGTEATISTHHAQIRAARRQRPCQIRVRSRWPTATDADLVCLRERLGSSSEATSGPPRPRPDRTVTPEVAGSNPVAPVSQSPIAASFPARCVACDGGTRAKRSAGRPDRNTGCRHINRGRARVECSDRSWRSGAGTKRGHEGLAWPRLEEARQTPA